MAEPKNRIRVQFAFELSIHEQGFPDWLGMIIDEGINALIDEGKAQSPITRHKGIKYTLTRVLPAELKRRETRRKNKEARRG